MIHFINDNTSINNTTSINRNSLRRSLALALLGLSASTLHPSAHASEWDKCWTGAKLRWPGTTVTMRAYTNGFPSGGYWTNGLITARSAWDKSPASFRYTIQTGDTNVGLANGQSEIWWSSQLDDDVLGVCYSYSNVFTCKYSEADVVFNNQQSFTTSSSKTNQWAYGGGLYGKKAKPFYFPATAIHELGHAQGLMHEGNTYNVMGISETHMHANGSTARCYAGEDSVDASIDVYGKFAQPLEDLAVAHWRYSDKIVVEGQLAYSTHERTRVFRNGSECSLSLLNDAEPIYEVDQGWNIDLELSYENLGKTTKSVTVKYYLSTNDYISKYDSYLGSRTMTLGVNTVYTSKTALTIPSWVNNNQVYWIGAVMDPDNNIDEIDTWNNATYQAIRIK